MKTSNVMVTIVALVAALTPFVAGTQLQEWFGLSDSGLNVLRGAFAIGAVVLEVLGNGAIKKSATQP